MEPIGNNIIAESNQPWGGWGQAPEQQFGGSPMVFGGDRLTSSALPGAFGDAFPGAYGAGESASGSGVFSQLLGFAQNVFGELGQLMQQVMGQGGASGQPCANGPCNGQQAAGPQQYFNNASLSSVGDPHDSFSGTTGSGQAVNGKWDNMNSHGRLITSDSIPGGFNVSTTATTPNAQGITYNQQATITTNNGNTVVSMGANGTPSVTDEGQQVSLTAGRTSTLSNGETVTLNQDGSLNVGVSNGQGGTITTTLKSNGNGVDVSATANNVDLGGYLANKQDGAFSNSAPAPAPLTGFQFPSYEPYQPYQPYQSYEPYGEPNQGYREPSPFGTDDPI